MRILLLILPLILLVASPAVASARSVDRCAKLSAFAHPDISAIRTDRVHSSIWTPREEQPPLTSLPPFCRVVLTLGPSIGVEVWLPEDSWNGRYRSEGSGGFGGTINYTAMAEAVRKGYATASTDNGYRLAAGDTPGGFALDQDGHLNRAIVADFAVRSLEQLPLKAKMMVKAFYGKAPRYSYFVGCSAGARQGLASLQRFPLEYDGVIVGCSPGAWERELPTFLWPQVVMRQRLGGPLAEKKQRALVEAVNEACDAIDGAKDNVIVDPRRCHYDPASLICGPGRDEQTCLTPIEAQAVAVLWEGPRSRRTGGRLWFVPDRHVRAATWGQAPYPAGLTHLRWIFEAWNPDWTLLTEENFEDYLRQSIEKLGPLLSTDNPNIAPFLAHGGKLLMWHADSDWGDSPRNSIRYYSRVTESADNGGMARKGVRLYLIPGMGHCGYEWPSFRMSDLPVAETLFNALVAWVEKGSPPERLTTPALPQARAATLCAYPSFPKTTEQGSTDIKPAPCVPSAQSPSDFVVAQ